LTPLLEGATPYREEDAARYLRDGWWRGLALSDWLDRAADTHPNEVGFIDSESRLTYGQTREQSIRLAVGLVRLGIRPLDRVMIQLPNWNEVAPLYFALQRIGAIPVMLIDRYREHEIERLAELSGASAWVVPLRFRKTDYLPIIEHVLGHNRAIKQVITVRGEATEQGFASLRRLIDETEPTLAELDQLAALRPDPMQVAHMGPTGGSTGTPKIVPRTHNSLGATAEFCSQAWTLDRGDTNLIVGSIGHDLSYTKGFLGSVITMCPVVLLDATDSESICKTVEREKVTAVVWVPTLAQRLLEFEDLDNYDLTSLAKMHSGGAAALPGLIEKVTTRLGVTFFNGYGATEGMTTITAATDDLQTIISCVGRPSCPGDEYKVVDFDGRTLPTGESGELLVKGPGVFTGYYLNDEENSKAFDADGFFRTGDVARISEDGCVTITGRIKEMINRGGESMSATVIEKLMDRHPDIAAVAVVAMPDPLMGERVCAYVQPRTGCDLTFEAVVTFLREEKASVLELPERIEFVAEMPYTPAHKTDKKALQADIAAKLAAEQKL
jgi:non-ribosomal peptide synthetase component E (peptide arylation enzyme)